MRTSGSRGGKAGRYTVSIFPRDLDLPQLARWVREEFSRVHQGFEAVWEFEIRTEAPGRIRAGVVAYADGTNWDPGYGEGPYFYRSSDDTWVPMFDISV